MRGDVSEGGFTFTQFERGDKIKNDSKIGDGGFEFMQWQEK